MAMLAPVFGFLGSSLGTTALGAVGTAVSAIGAISSANAQQQAAQQQAAIAQQQAQAQADAANFNKQVQENNAQLVENQAAAKAAEIEKQNRLRLASARAGALNSGLELDGTTAGVMGQADRSGHLDALTALYDGSINATALRNNATLYGAQAQNAITSGNMTAAAYRSKADSIGASLPWTVGSNLLTGLYGFSKDAATGVGRQLSVLN